MRARAALQVEQHYNISSKVALPLPNIDKKKTKKNEEGE